MSQEQDARYERLETFDEFRDVLASQAERPIHHDPFIAAYSSAMYEITEQEEVVSLFVDSLLPTLQRNGSLDGWLLNNIAFRSVHRWLLHPPSDLPISYPDDSFMQPDGYAVYLPQILGTNGHTDDGRFSADVLWRKIQSNKAERYKTIKLLGLLFPEYAEGYSVLDVGSSQNQGLKQVALHVPFGHTTVEDSSGELTPKDMAVASYTVVSSVNNRQFQLGNSWGTDFFKDTDVENREWVMACSLIPSEIMIPGNIERYLWLQNSQPENVHFIRSDFGMYDTMPLFPDDPDLQFDAVTFFTMLYQVPPHERIVMFEKAKQLSRRFIVVQDAAEKIESSRHAHPMTELAFDAANFNVDYGYRVFIYDKEEPDKGFQEAWRWKSGRSEVLQLINEGELSTKALHAFARKAMK